MNKSYVRPMPDQHDKDQVKAAIAKVFNSHNVKMIGLLLAEIFLENITLVKEINAHREALGYELMKTSDPVEYVISRMKGFGKFTG